VGAKRARTPRDECRRALGQNFLADRAVAARLVRAAGVRSSDLVVELGAGTGTLTVELAGRAGRVQAVEVDPVWAQHLRKRFARSGNMDVLEGDLLRVRLPTRPFRVVANMPFNLTTQLLRRLVDQPANGLLRAHLIVQWEVARKRAGRPRTALSVAIPSVPPRGRGDSRR
jgi:23S rRNA (adenine-N6)-dimethyltransferase